jgi:hypothetical protein
MYCLVGGLRQALARSGVVLSKGGLKTNTYYKPEHRHTWPIPARTARRRERRVRMI